MRAFVATSIRNREEALRIISILKRLSIEYQCCVTENENMHGKELFEHNLKGISESDIFISVLKEPGRDVSTEIGIAYALGKPSIGIAYNISSEDVMTYYASGKIINEEHLERELMGMITTDSRIAFSDFKQHSLHAVAKQFREIFNSGCFVDGIYSKLLESNLSERYLRPTVVTNTGTSALILALDTILDSKMEVIVPSLTFNATIQAIIHAGGRPVFADVDCKTWTLSPEDVYKKISKNTGAIMPVNLFGVPADISSFKKISECKDIPLIYDSCQAFGTITTEGEVGTFGDIEAFSLDATKVLSGILGGFITLKDSELYEKAKVVKNFGNNYEKKTVQKGINGRITEFNAVLALESLSTVGSRLSKLKMTAQKYKQVLSGISHIEFQEESNGVSAAQYFGILINYGEESIARRIQADLFAQGIETRIYNPTLLHKLSFFTNIEYSLPNTEKMLSRILCLPTHDKVMDRHVEKIAETLRRYVQ
jgi:dTDP-4-amino-4,6-dideoxygalactose transaminase